MSIKASRKSGDVSESVEVVTSVDEKHDIDTSVSISSEAHSDGDEALQLVGKERLTEFSDEYNRKLRRKLVRQYTCTVCSNWPELILINFPQDFIIPPICAAVYFTQFLYVSTILQEYNFHIILGIKRL